MSNSQILELCNFTLTPSLLIQKRHCLIRKGFRLNTRTKYQAKFEGVRGTVVSVEGIQKKTKVKKPRSGVNLIQWFPGMCYVEKRNVPLFSRSDFKCSVFVLWIFCFYHTCFCIIHVFTKRDGVLMK